MNKWTKRFLDLAKTAASWSKDSDCQVGACLVSPDRREFAFGYNGYPAELVEYPHIKKAKNEFTVHAEVNAILNARRNLTGWTLYTTKTPCLDCAKAIIQAGIGALWCPMPERKSKWFQPNVKALSIMTSVGITVRLVDDNDTVFFPTLINNQDVQLSPLN